MTVNSKHNPGKAELGRSADQITSRMIPIKAVCRIYSTELAPREFAHGAEQETKRNILIVQSQELVLATTSSHAGAFEICELCFASTACACIELKVMPFGGA